MKGIKINHTTQTIIVTKAFSKAAANPLSDEYTLLKTVKTDFPSMRVVEKESSNRRNDYKGLTYPFMRRFIVNLDPENFHAYNETIVYYEKMYTNSVTVFNNVRAWFLENYPDYKDMIVDNEPKRAAMVAVVAGQKVAA